MIKCKSRPYSIVVLWAAALIAAPNPVEAESLSETLGVALGPNGSAFSELGRSATGGEGFFDAPGNAFHYRFDAASGIPVLVEEGFGPIVTARAYTIGKGHYSLSTSVIGVPLESADGVDLGNGEISLPVLTPFGLGTSNVRIDAQVILFNSALAYGVLDNLDVILRAPFTSNSLRVQTTTTVGGVSSTTERSNAYTGLADVVLGLRWKALERERYVVGVLAQITAPTGSEDNFTGQGTWKFSPRLLFSTQGTRVNAHLNLGVTVAQSKINDKFNYSFGVEWAVTKPVTLSAEVQGNYEINNRRISLSALLKGTQDLAASDDHQFVAGAKWNLWRKVLIGATFSIPLNDTGLQWGISGGMTAEASF